MADILQPTPLLLRSTTILGLTSTLLLSGLNLTTSLLFIPHLPPLPTETSTRIFTHLYHNGMKAVVPLAATGIASFCYLAYATNEPKLAVASGLVASTLVWTRIVVMPVNERLIAISKTTSGTKEEVEGLLRAWSWMNYVRGFIALGGGLLALSAVVV